MYQIDEKEFIDNEINKKKIEKIELFADFRCLRKRLELERHCNYQLQKGNIIANVYDKLEV